MMNLSLQSITQKHLYSCTSWRVILLFLFLSVSCKNQASKEEASIDEDPKAAIENMVNETKALAKAEAAQVDVKTHKTLESLRNLKFGAETAAEKLFKAILAGKDLYQEVFLFRTLNFAPKQTAISAEMQAELSQLAKIMTAFPELKFEIGVHTEGVGDPLENLTLSLDRANAIVEALTQSGVDKSRMTAMGYGDEMPIADKKMVAGRAANQRVELTFFK